MTHDVVVLRNILMIPVVIAAIGVNTQAIVYSRGAWHKRVFGLVFMAKTVSFAAALDMTIIFQFWRPDILVSFWIQFIIFCAIAVSTNVFDVILWRMQNRSEKANNESEDE